MFHLKLYQNVRGVMLSLSKHAGKGLSARHFDGAQCDNAPLSVRQFLFHISLIHNLGLLADGFGVDQFQQFFCKLRA